MKDEQNQYLVKNKLLQGYCPILFAILVLLVFTAMVLIAGAQKSETIDEGLFIAGGAAQVHYLNPNIDLSHPPLLRWLSGVSVTLFGKARVPEPVPFTSCGPMDLSSYKVQDVFIFGVNFFYDSWNNHDQVLFWGRFPFVFLGVLLGWILFIFMRRNFGPVPALLSLLSFLFMPEVLAHAQWAHSDLASALTIFIVSLALIRLILKPSRLSDVFLGAAMGLAVATKLTSLVLWPLIVLLIIMFRWKRFAAILESLGISLAVFYIAIVIAYLPSPQIFGPHEFYRTDLLRLGIAWFEPLLRLMPLPDMFLKGIVYTLLLGQHGQSAFFHGYVSTGWWYYFPVAIFLKYPTGLLVVAIAGLIALWLGPWSRALKAALTFPPLVILGAAMTQSVNIGVRSVLFLAPYLALWSGVALWHWRGKLVRGVIIFLLLTSVISGIFSYPDFLSYFNPFFGGTAAADKWLIDSNLDWGQDLPALAKELKRRDIHEVRLAYFGIARPSYYGIRALSPNSIAPGWYAISRSFLSGWLPPGDPYGWLRSLQPEMLVGGSIALFHIDEEALWKSGMKSNEVSEKETVKKGLKALYEQNDYEGAAVYFRKVLEKNPTHYGATFQLAKALDQQGKQAEARSLWKRALKMAEQYQDKETAEIVRGQLKRER